ncbi:MAG: TlyA family RNA methyltransferase [Magnetococcus sp. DMHC-6]
MVSVVRFRLDKLMLKRGLVLNLVEARALITAGEVLVGGRLLTNPASMVLSSLSICFKKKGMEWVSRGGMKLVHALQSWEIDLQGLTCLDVGASTGGFTHVLLTYGAGLVYAMDVGYGQLAWSLVQDSRVRVLDRTNIRQIDPSTFPELVDFITLDVSFISLTKVLPSAMALLRPGGQGIALVKPQFELPRGQVEKGGVVRDPFSHQQALEKILAFLPQMDLTHQATLTSPITGPAGNQEFLLWFKKGHRAPTLLHSF